MAASFPTKSRQRVVSQQDYSNWKEMRSGVHSSSPLLLLLGCFPSSGVAVMVLNIISSTLNCASSAIMSNLGVTLYVMTNLQHHYRNSCRMSKNEDISNPFEVSERKTLAVQNMADKN